MTFKAEKNKQGNVGVSDNRASEGGVYRAKRMPAKRLRRLVARFLGTSLRPSRRN